VRLDEQPFVGSAAARAVHGHSAGGAVVFLGGVEPSADLRESLDPFGLSVAGPWGPDRPDWLASLASLAEGDQDAPLVLVAADLTISPVALLDLLDRPGDPTAAVTVEQQALRTSGSDLTLLRVHPEQKLLHSVGTTRHTVTAPTHLGLGVVRLSGAHRAQAAQLWRAASSTGAAADPSVDPFDLALLVLVRGGIRVGSSPLGPFAFRRGVDEAPGARGSAWQQRLRGASRGGDGYFSTRVIRPMSRRVTAVGLRQGWTPNAVTVTSLGVGLVASGRAALDNRRAWVAAAVLLQVAIVIDCVDGEIARFTRRFSALGAWLDAVGDRIKEYSLIAAVAVVAARRGDDLWVLAILAMVLITARHLEDYAYVHRARVAKAHETPDLLPVEAPQDLGPDGARLTIPPARRGLAEAVFWTKKVLHLPIAERYLLLSVGLLTFNPRWLLWAITVAVAFALVWTQGGRTVKAVLGLDDHRVDESLSPEHWGHLDHQADLGPVARVAGRVAGRVVRGPLAVALVGVVVLLGAVFVAARTDRPWVAVALVVLGVLLVGVGSRPPLQSPLAWQLPTLLWAAEALLVIGLLLADPDVHRWTGFAYLAAVAWHRYDVVYRLRDTGAPASAWVTLVTLGVDGRMLLLVVVWALGGPVQAVLAWAALVLIVVYAVESALGWRTWARAEAGAVTADDEVMA
jgi:phosphatidylglycerophosphate synthase